MNIAKQIAQYLSDESIGVYSPNASDGNIFINSSYEKPNIQISIYNRAGEIGDHRNGYEKPIIQIITRGEVGAFGTTYDLSQSIYNKLHALQNVLLITTGNDVVSILGRQSGPIPLETDKNGRPSFSLNFDIEYKI